MASKDQRKTPVRASGGVVIDGHQHSPSPAHYRIPHETGYFPAGSDEVDALAAKIENATLHRIHPPPGGEPDGQPLASGALTLRDPDAGTADDVVLVGQCGDTIFYVMIDDASTKISGSEFSLMLPEDCFVIDLTGCADEDVLKVEGLLAARTQFHDETTASPIIYPENLPNDCVSKAMFRVSFKLSKMTVGMGELGASKIDAYGEKKKEEVTETKEIKVGKGTVMLAKGTRAVSKQTHTVTEKISTKIADVLGGKLGRVVAVKEGDSAMKKKGRSLLLTSAIAYAEIGSGASEGYELMVESAQSQATSFVAKKYGKDAAELTRHTAGAAANFGRAALTARRVVSVKKVVKSAGKQMVEEKTKGSR